MSFYTILIGGLFLYIYNIYGWHKLVNKRIDIKNYKNYIAMIVFVGVGAIINFYIHSSIKMFLVTILLFIVADILVFHNKRKAIVATILLQLITMLVEIGITLILNMFFSVEDAVSFMKNDLNYLLVSFGISLVSIFLISIHKVRTIYGKIIKLTIKIKDNNLIKYSLVMLLFATIFTSTIYIKANFQIVAAINTTAIVFFCWLAIKMSNSEAKYDETAENYKTSKALLECTEKEMDEYMSNNHEIKKELQIIEQMVLDKDPSVIEYVQALKDRNKKINIEDNVQKQIEKIPLKLLRYLVKDRITESKELNVKFNIDISNRLKKSKFLKLGKQDELDICDIVSVFLGNSIAALEKLNKKEVSLEIYPEVNSVYICVSNNYEGYISIEEISNPGYTTKGKGHGYGLTLVKKIIKRNTKLENETEISKDVFKQILKIKV